MRLGVGDWKLHSMRTKKKPRADARGFFTG